MFRNIEEKKARHKELQGLISDPRVIANSSLYQKYAKELAELSKLVNRYNEYQRLLKEIKDTETVLGEKGHDASFIEFYVY